jgi:hypothetical protein
MLCSILILFHGVSGAIPLDPSQAESGLLFEGKHWLDCDEKNVAEFEAITKRVAGLPAKQLRRSTLAYLCPRLDSEQVLNQKELYKRAIDIRIVTSLLVDPSLYLGIHRVYGASEVFRLALPWHIRDFQWRLRPPTEAQMLLTSEHGRAYAELDAALRFLTNFPDDEEIYHVRSHALGLESSRPIFHLEILTESNLDVDQGLRVRVRVTNVSGVTLLFPFDSSNRACWKLIVDSKIARTGVIRNLGGQLAVLSELQADASSDQVLTLDEGLSLDSSRPGRYEGQVVLDLTSQERLGFPTSDALLVRRVVSGRFKIDLESNGTYSIIGSNTTEEQCP